MFIDQNTAIISAAIIGVVGYAVQNYSVKKRELEKRDYERKEERYANFMRILATIMSPSIVQKGKVPDDLKEKLNKEIYLLQLYAPDMVVNAVNKWIDKLTPEVTGEELKNAWQHLVLTMRKDLRIKTELRESDIQLFRAD